MEGELGGEPIHVYVWLSCSVMHLKRVTVRVQVGKEFPDMRQSERRIKFIRVVRGESLPAQGASFLIVRESWCWTGVLDSFLYPGCKEQDRGLRWGSYMGGRAGEKDIPSPFMRKERRQVMLVRRTWNSLRVTTLGMGGKDNKGLVFPFLYSKTLLGFICSFLLQFSSLLSHVWRFGHVGPLCPTPTHRSLLKLMSIELVISSSHLILWHPPLLPPSIFPSIRVFSSESVLRIKWPKYWSFSFSISPSNEYSGLISFRMHWLDILAVQGTQESSPTSVQKHQFFGAQLSL